MLSENNKTTIALKKKQFHVYVRLPLHSIRQLSFVISSSHFPLQHTGPLLASGIIEDVIPRTCVLVQDTHIHTQARLIQVKPRLNDPDPVPWKKKKLLT